MYISTHLLNKSLAKIVPYKINGWKCAKSLAYMWLVCYRFVVHCTMSETHFGYYIMYMLQAYSFKYMDY